MFERYTESARRSLFFARYECSQLGSMQIDTEHVLLGIIREGVGLTGRLLARADVEPGTLRDEICGEATGVEKVATSVEIPFSEAAKRVLHHAAEEADRLGHNYIGTEHMLLGLLREEHSKAAKTLTRHGITLDAVRTDVTLFGDKNGPAGERPAAMDVEANLNNISRVAGEILGVISTTPFETQHVVSEMVRTIQDEVETLKRFLFS